MRLKRCEGLKRQGYQFVKPGSSAAVKPCLWCKMSLTGGGQCYKHQFYGIESHLCVQMTPTLMCNQRCLFCWRSFEYEEPDTFILQPHEIIEALPGLQKKALSGYKVNPHVPEERFLEALTPRHVAISLSGEPTLYPWLPELIDRLTEKNYSTFLVSNGTKPEMLRRCRPTQLYISLDAPDKETYESLCRPSSDLWANVLTSISEMSRQRSAVRITMVKGINDHSPEKYGAILKDSGATFIEVKGYMYLGYSRKRLERGNMPEHTEVQEFAKSISEYSDYKILDESPLSRVICLERGV